MTDPDILISTSSQVFNFIFCIIIPLQGIFNIELFFSF
jgi:hypothetical protein